MVMALVMVSGIIFTSIVVNEVAIATTEEEESKREPAELISTIRDLLNQTIVEYNKQNYTDAADLADVAYIDN